MDTFAAAAHDEARKRQVFADRAAATMLKRIGQPIDIALAMLASPPTRAAL